MAFALASTGIPSAQTAIVTLHPDERIQAAIDRATAGDVIVVEDGVYYESMHIDKW